LQTNGFSASDKGSAKRSSPCPLANRRSSEGLETGPLDWELEFIFEEETSSLDFKTLNRSPEDFVGPDQPEQESIDDEDVMSDVIDDTDLSLVKAFEAYLVVFDSILFSLLASV